MVHQVSSDDEFRTLVNDPAGRLVVVDFFATWCGPCVRSAPQVEELSRKYNNVVFLKVDVDQLNSVSMAAGVRAMPTFQFMKGGKKIDEVVGANIPEIESKVQKHQTATTFSGQGRTLGGTGAAPPTIVPRPNVGVERPAPPPGLYGEEDDEELVRALAISKGTKPAAAKPSPAPAAVSINPLFVANLVEMGFPELRAKKGLLKTGGNSVDQAMEWIFQHADDADIDDPIPGLESVPSAPAVGESGSDVSMTTEVVQEPPKEETPEEREHRAAEAKRKAAELQERARLKRAEEEAKAEKARELDRRHSGKEMAKTKQEIEDLARKRAMEEKRREAEEDRKYKEKVRKQLEQDKLERMAKQKGEAPPAAAPAAPAAAAPAAPSATQAYTECTIQVRLLDGSALRHTFAPTDTLRTVFNWIVANRTDGKAPFSMTTTFPKQVFTGTMLNMTLQEAGLAPRGQITLSKNLA